MTFIEWVRNEINSIPDNNLLLNDFSDDGVIEYAYPCEGKIFTVCSVEYFWCKVYNPSENKESHVQVELHFRGEAFSDENGFSKVGTGEMTQEIFMKGLLHIFEYHQLSYKETVTSLKRLYRDCLNYWEREYDRISSNSENDSRRLLLTERTVKERAIIDIECVHHDPKVIMGRFLNDRAKHDFLELLKSTNG